MLSTNKDRVIIFMATGIVKGKQVIVGIWPYNHNGMTSEEISLFVKRRDLILKTYNIPDNCLSFYHL